MRVNSGWKGTAHWNRECGSPLRWLSRKGDNQSLCASSRFWVLSFQRENMLSHDKLKNQNFQACVFLDVRVCGCVWRGVSFVFFPETWNWRSIFSRQKEKERDKCCFLFFHFFLKATKHFFCAKKTSSPDWTRNSRHAENFLFHSFYLETNTDRKHNTWEINLQTNLKQKCIWNFTN